VQQEHPHYVTPEEAEEKTCPFDAKNWGTCMSSQCMAWRWKPEKEAVETKDAFYFKDVYSTTHGYCGMVRQ